MDYKMDGEHGWMNGWMDAFHTQMKRDKKKYIFLFQIYCSPQQLNCFPNLPLGINKMQLSIHGC